MAKRHVWPGTVGRVRKGLPTGLMFFMPGWLKRCQETGCAFWRRRRKTEIRRKSWRSLNLIRWSMGIRSGWMDLSLRQGRLNADWRRGWLFLTGALSARRLPVPAGFNIKVSVRQRYPLMYLMSAIGYAVLCLAGLIIIKGFTWQVWDAFSISTIYTSEESSL